MSRPPAAVRTALLTCLLSLAVAALATPAKAAAGAPSHIVQLQAGVPLADGRAAVRATGGRVEATLPIIRGLSARLPAGARRELLRDPRVKAVTVNARVVSSSLTMEPLSDPAAEQPAVEQPAVEQPAIEQPAIEQPAVEQPAVEQPATEQPATEQPATEQPATEQPATEQPATDEPATDEPADAVSAGVDTSRLVSAYPYSVLVPQAWGSATGAGVGVAVIDTGIDGGLPDFKGDGGGSRVVASVVTNPRASTTNDTYGHGTHVAGIIAGDGTRREADDRSVGKYIGIAPEANLISIKIDDDDGYATILDAIYGLQFVVDHKDDYGIRVVNLSLESTVAQSYRTDPLDAAVEAAYFHGILVVAAAGNQGATAEAANYAPGNDPFALSVGAVDDQKTQTRSDDAYTEWSSVGVTQDGYRKPEIAAPGAHIVSTLARGSAFGTLCPSCVVDGDYIQAGGTSMAAPVVSGVAALIFERNPTWTPDQVKSTLIETARNLEGGVDEVNANTALAIEVPYGGANNGVAPNELVDQTSGEIDYTRSSWSRSSWSSAPERLTAGWSRSSWSCACSSSEADAVDPTRSSWSRSSWSTKWSY